MIAETYARALRAVAIVLAVLTIGRALTGGSHPADVAQRLAAIRLVTAAVAVLVAFLSTPSREIPGIRRLAFLLGVDGWAGALGVMIVTPETAWEGGALIVAVLLGAALFMPWSWRWQASLATIVVVGTGAALPWLNPPDGAAGIARLLSTLAVLGAASVLGALFADRERRRVAAYEAEQREQERRRVREQRIESLTRLAGGFAHQFNNLLGGILTHASVLHDDASYAAHREELAQILAAARRGRELTKELLSFTQEAPLTLRPTPVRTVVERVAELARAELPTGTRITVHLPEGGSLPPLLADADHLVHACHELVLNARDAMRGRPDPTLVLTAAEERVATGDRHWPDTVPGLYVRLSVSDSGVGMDAATLERVFEPFFTTKPIHQAAGLGLAGVYSVVRGHRGLVRIDSEVRRGTTVHLLVPVATEAAAAPAPSPAVPAPSEAVRRATVLVVDDEPIVRSSVRRALSRLGYDVLEAQDGPSAMATMQAARPPVDLVILDLVLPGGGAGIFELLRAVQPGLRVLVSSGYSPDDATVKALGDRADGFLPKPYEIAELREAVARVLGT